MLERDYFSFYFLTINEKDESINFSYIAKAKGIQKSLIQKKASPRTFTVPQRGPTPQTVFITENRLIGKFSQKYILTSVQTTTCVDI